VLAPSQPIETINYFEWPQGYKDYITTTKITYSSGYELWMVKTLDVTSFTLWFYLDDWHIVPDIDHEHLSLTFPPIGSSPVKE
jgi:hypothetical protein